MPSDLYEQPRPEISQGDILDVLPHVSINKPLVALSRQGESTFVAETEPFIAFNDKDGQTIVASCKREKAILITHDCEIDKPAVKKWLICPVVPIARLKPANHDLLRRNRIFSMLHLPTLDAVLGESFVDFNHISTLDPELLKSANRIISLSDLGRRALYVQFFRFVTRWELREVACPMCGSEFDPNQNKSVRSA